MILFQMESCFFATQNDAQLKMQMASIVTALARITCYVIAKSGSLPIFILRQGRRNIQMSKCSTIYIYKRVL